jgi:hypothetical protein
VLEQIRAGMGRLQVTEFLIKLGQFSIAAVVGCSAMWFQQAYHYPINPYIVAAWAFMAAYGATLGIVRLLDWRVKARAHRE